MVPGLPISPERHDEGDHYLITVPNTDFKGSTCQVEFMHGEARIDDEELARHLCEVFDYTVVFPQDAVLPEWAMVEPPVLKTKREDPKVIRVQSVKKP